MSVETGVSLDLSAEEADGLRDALAEYLSDLSVEISGTESQEFRDRLKRRQELIRRVMRSLSGAPA
jgi:hypothetical protein